MDKLGQTEVRLSANSGWMVCHCRSQDKDSFWCYTDQLDVRYEFVYKVI